MNRFWDAIICPLFNELKPKCIVEVGADCGLNTKNILDYCSNNDSKLVSIDPNPNFNVSDFLKSYGKKFVFLEDLSLNILQIFNDYDIILIDGDHNWYTVYNELKSIEKNFNQNSFPVIILHDVSWPYGRRDCYYNPENIPKEYIHEFKKWGIVPYQNELDKDMGINNHLDNAFYENSPKNGVLTAIEDFLDETNLKLSFYKINGFNGLGIIYPYNKSMDKLISKIVYDSELTEMIEKNYIKRLIIEKNTIKSYKNQFSNVEDELQGNKANFVKLKENYDNLVDKNESLINVNSSLSEINEKLNSEKKSLNKLYEDLISERDKLAEENNRLNSENNTLIENNELLLNKLSSMTKSKKKLSFERNSLVKQNASLSELNVDLISERDALIKQNSNLFEENKKLNSEKNSLTKLNDSLISEKDSWLERNSNLSNANLVLIDENNSIKKNNSDLSNTNLVLIDENNSIKKNNSDLYNANLVLIDENNSIKKNNSDLSKKIDSLNNLNKTMVDEKVSLVKSLNDSNIKMRFMVKQNQVLLSQNDELMENYKNILNSNSWKITGILRKIRNLK